MAAANEVLTVALHTRIGPLEGGQSLYIGTCVGGTEYKTGGVPLVESGTSRIKLPGSFEWVAIGSLAATSWSATGQALKFLQAQAAEAASAEFTAAKTMATVAPAGTLFIGVGAN